MKASSIVAAAALALVGCKAIPLNDDPTVPRREANVSRAAVYEVAWRQSLVKPGLMEYQPSEPAEPAIDPETERIVVATRDGFVRCLSPVDGTVEWQHKTAGRFLGGPTISKGVVYAASGDGVLYALRAASGEKLWEFKANEELVTAPTVAGGRVLVASQGETLFAVDAETGAWAWQYRRDPPSGFTVRGAARPSVAGGVAYAGFADGALVALEVATGVVKWERRLSVSGGSQFLDVDTSPVVAEGRVYAASYKDGLYALDAATGDTVWSSSRGGLTGLVQRGATLFASGDGAVTAFDAGSGRMLWSLDISDSTPRGKAHNAGRSMSLARGYVVVPTATALAFVEPSSGKVRAMWDPGRGVTAAPAGTSSPRFGARLYVMSNLGTVYALQLVGAGG